jgi:hypothetical protein
MSEPQRRRKLYHNFEQARVLALSERVFDKLHIKLQRVNRHIREHTQRGIAAAEIVHFNPEAVLTELFDLFNNQLRVFGICRLGYFKNQLVKAKTVIPDNAEQLVISSAS